jgi:hypothetical protein
LAVEIVGVKNCERYLRCRQPRGLRQRGGWKRQRQHERQGKECSNMLKHHFPPVEIQLKNGWNSTEENVSSPSFFSTGDKKTARSGKPR